MKEEYIKPEIVFEKLDKCAIITATSPCVEAEVPDMPCGDYDPNCDCDCNSGGNWDFDEMDF